MASVTKRRGGWAVRWRDPDGTQRLRTCPDRATAQALARDVDRRVALGHRWEPADIRPRARVGEAMTAYLADRSRVLAPRTVVRLSEALGYAVDCWGDVPLESLTRSHLADLYAWLRVGGRRDADGNQTDRGRTESTCAKHVQAVQAWWAWVAADERFEDVCPLPRTIDLPKRTLGRLPVAPTWAECDRMIAELRVDWHRRVAVLARFTGARRSELVALDWRDVDLEAATITWQPEDTKGGYGGRVVPMPPALVDELAGWGRREGRVCQAPPTEIAQGHRGHVDRDVRRAWERAGVRREAWEGQPLHSMRKAIETELRTRGVAPEVIDAYLGHAAVGTGGRHYADPRWAWDRMVEAAKMIEPVRESRRLEVL